MGEYFELANSEKMTKLLEYLTDITNRSERQTKELFELCGCDFLKLCTLEYKLWDKGLHLSPSTKKEIDEILKS